MSMRIRHISGWRRKRTLWWRFPVVQGYVVWPFPFLNSIFTHCATVVFRMVVFRPFASEVIVAKVKSSDEDGIRRRTSFCANEVALWIISLVSVGFFDDIYIPVMWLPEPCALYVSCCTSLYAFSFSKFLPMSVTPMNERISGFQAQKQKQVTSCSIAQPTTACTSMQGRLCEFV